MYGALFFLEFSIIISKYYVCYRYLNEYVVAICVSWQIQSVSVKLDVERWW